MKIPIVPPATVDDMKLNKTGPNKLYIQAVIQTKLSRKKLKHHLNLKRKKMCLTFFGKFDASVKVCVPAIRRYKEVTIIKTFIHIRRSQLYK